MRRYRRRRSRRVCRRPYRRSVRRSFPRRRRFRRRGGIPLSRNPSISLPRKRLVRLRYIDQADYTSALTTTSLCYSASGLFDPYITGVGGQPRGFDQWAALYDRYQVIGCMITVRFSNHDTTYSDTLCGIELSRSTYVSISTVKDFFEQPWCTSKVLNGDMSRTVTLKKNFSTRKFFDVKNPMDASSISAAVTANPSAQGYFHICTRPFGDQYTNDVAALICIDYIAIFYRSPTFGES